MTRHLRRLTDAVSEAVQVGLDQQMNSLLNLFFLLRSFLASFVETICLELEVLVEVRHGAVTAASPVLRRSSVDNKLAHGCGTATQSL